MVSVLVMNNYVSITKGGPKCYHDFGTTMIIPSNHWINGSESAYGNGNVSYIIIESGGTNPFNSTLGPL
jgi:hypothetical protein